MSARKGDKHPKMIGNKYALGNKGGRPPSYELKFCQAIIDYFSTPASQEYTYKETLEYYKDGGIKRKSFEKKPLPNKLPTFYGFAASIGVNQDTLHEWKKKHKEFSEAFASAKELQKEFIIENGLSGASPSTFAIFVAKNLTDMKDKQEITGDIASTVRYINAPKPYERTNNGYTMGATPGATDRSVEV